MASTEKSIKSTTYTIYTKRYKFGGGQLLKKLTFTQANGTLK